jgi:hypothetical protein
MPVRHETVVFSYVQTGRGPTQPRQMWVPVDFTQGVKRLERETDHLPPKAEIT